MTDLHILLDNTNFDRKPTSKETASINNRLNHLFTQITVEDFAAQVTSPNGKSYCPANFNGSRSNENWISQQVFALDFDNDKTIITFDAVLAKLNDYGLNCTFAYNTFSSTPDLPKFRVIFQTDLITDLNERNAIQFGLIELFKANVDISCKDPARLYFGGKDLIYQNYSYVLDAALLNDSVRCEVVAGSKSNNLNRDLKNFDKKLIKNRIFNIYSITFSTTPSISSITQTLRLDWGDLRDKIKIVDDFLSGKKLTHQQLFGIATNFIYIYGGVAMYKNCLDSNDNYKENKYHLPSIAKYYNYCPMNLENFSPYESDHSYGNILQAYQNKVTRLMIEPKMSLSEAEDKYKEILDNVLNSTENKINVIRVPTGLGKTESILNLKNVTIALPYHNLKEEVSERFKGDYNLTPELPNNLPKQIYEELNYYYKIGALKEANKFLYEQAKNNSDIRNYLNDTLKCYASNDTVITTHQKALFVDFENHNTLIFDEDPINSILSMGKVTVNDFFRLKGQLTDKEDINVINSYLEYLEKNLVSSPIKTNLVAFKNYSEIEKIVLNSSIPWDGNILQFFESDYFVIDSYDKATIHFIKLNQLPSNKKIIILSATANEFIYKKLFGDLINFYDISNIELTGVILQDCKYSFSRHSLKEHHKYITDKGHDCPVITFAEFKHYFSNAVKELHFGKTSGFDGLKDSDLVVVGLPHISPILYLLYSQILNIKFTPKDFKIRYQLIQYDGLEFPLQTYDNEAIRKIQLSRIESELRQAVGRSRVSRNPNTVYLYSGFPLKESCLTEKEKCIGLSKLNRLH